MCHHLIGPNKVSMFDPYSRWWYQVAALLYGLCSNHMQMPCESKFPSETHIEALLFNIPQRKMNVPKFYSYRSWPHQTIKDIVNNLINKVLCITNHRPRLYLEKGNQTQIDVIFFFFLLTWAHHQINQMWHVDSVLITSVLRVIHLDWCVG